MEPYETAIDTTVEINVLSGGGTEIILASAPGEDSEKLYTHQIITLPVEQSKALYEQLKQYFESQVEPVLPQEPHGLLDHLYDDTMLPEEPEEAGLYVSQQGHVLRKYGDTDWGYAGSNLIFNDGEKQWSNGERYTNDWDLIIKDLGEDAFPLMQITRSDIASLAQSKSKE